MNRDFKNYKKFGHCKRRFSDDPISNICSYWSLLAGIWLLWDVVSGAEAGRCFTCLEGYCRQNKSDKKKTETFQHVARSNLQHSPDRVMWMFFRPLLAPRRWFSSARRLSTRLTGKSCWIWSLPVWSLTALNWFSAANKPDSVSALTHTHMLLWIHLRCARLLSHLLVPFPALAWLSSHSSFRPRRAGEPAPCLAFSVSISACCSTVPQLHLLSSVCL